MVASQFGVSWIIRTMSPPTAKAAAKVLLLGRSDLINDGRAELSPSHETTRSTCLHRKRALSRRRYGGGERRGRVSRQRRRSGRLEVAAGPGEGCNVQGNISANGARIDHLQGLRDDARARMNDRSGQRMLRRADEAKPAGWGGGEAELRSSLARNPVTRLR